MGEFIHTAIIQNCTSAAASPVIQKAAATEEYSLNPAECQYLQRGTDLQILFNDQCSGFDPLTKMLSEELQCPTLMLYVYDGDFWGYFFYENGKELDTFTPMPDYFRKVSDEIRAKSAGNSALIAEYFRVDKAAIQNYLVLWTERSLDGGTKAYPTDEFEQGDSWQMTDFMEKLGFPYDFEPIT